MSSPPTNHSRVWAYGVCLLLLLATVINYLDRQALTLISPRIMTELKLDNEMYGWLETGFSLAFAVGLTVLGIGADRFNLRWFFPLVLLAWSAMGFATGLVSTYLGLVVCRTLLGFFEAGNWPCGIRVIQKVLRPEERPMGNGLLQSGGAIGAMLTPIIVPWFMTDEPGSWRLAFQVIGASGLMWIVLWFFFGPTYSQLAQPAPSPVNAPDESSIWPILRSRRFAVLLVVSISVNVCWHWLRVWLQNFLHFGRGYSQAEVMQFSFWYYLAADLGAWTGGAVVIWLYNRRGFSRHGARLVVYFVASCLTALSTLAVALPGGWALPATLLLVGCGSLGLFPFFFSLTQEISVRRQGTIVGILCSVPWLILAIIHPLFGNYVDLEHSYDLGLKLIGWLPMVSFAVLWFFWNEQETRVV